MRIGKLDRRIIIQRYKPSRDESSGEELKGWVNLYGELWASKRQQSGREAILAEQLVASNTAVFTIHYKEVKPKDRILCEGVYYDIKATSEIGRRQGLELITEAKDNGQAEPAV